ncbi:MAG: hypothetical protein R3D69_11995 [Xanthobacteraceae bacterium]
MTDETSPEVLPPPPPPPDTTPAKADAETKLALQAADHAHAEKTQAAELGWLGKCLGGEKSAPTSIAFIAVIIGSIIAFISLCLAAGNKDPDFLTAFERALAFVSASLAFIFGRGTRPEK